MRLRAIAAFLIAATCLAAEPETPFLRVAKLASSLSDGVLSGALESFDKSNPRYSAIAEKLEALTVQADVLCSIDVVEDKESGDDHRLDLDWYMTLKSKGNENLVERRRMRVAVTMKKFVVKQASVWRIVSLSPEEILDPIAIK